MSHPSPCEQSRCFSLSCSAFLFCAMNLHFLICLIPATFFFCCCYFNIKSLWLVEEAEREDALQLLTCFQHPCGGIGPSENQLLTCSKFLFTEIHFKKSQNSSFYSISFDLNFISFSCLPTTPLTSTHTQKGNPSFIFAPTSIQLSHERYF